MKRLITGISPIAAAVGLALGSGSLLAQQASEDPQDSQAPFEQRSNTAEQSQSAAADRSQSQSSDLSQSSDRSQSPDLAQQSDAPLTGSDSDFDQLAEGNADLSKFIEAVKTAGLADALTSGTDYTIFAPTDSALEGEDLESLMQPENRQELIALLRAHIVADDVSQELAGNIQQAQTIDGGTLDISMENEKLMVGDAEATEASGIEVANLRVYKVDQVLARGLPGDTGQRQAAIRQPGSDTNLPGLDDSEEANSSGRSAPQ